MTDHEISLVVDYDQNRINFRRSLNGRSCNRIALLTALTKTRFLTPIKKNLYLHIPVKPVTHLAILYADRGNRRKLPGVHGAAMAIFADRRDRRIKSPISGMSDIGD